MNFHISCENIRLFLSNITISFIIQSLIIASLLVQNNLLQSMKVEMVKVRQENEKLKSTLGQIINEYRSLEVHYHSIVQQKETNKNNFEASQVHDQESQKHPKFTPLSIRDDSRGTKHDDNTEPISKSKEKCTKVHEDLVLRLDCKYDGSNSVMSENTTHPSSEDSFQEAKEKEKEKETWSPSKIPKFNGEDGDEETPQPTVKRARVSVRARCDAPTVSPCALNLKLYMVLYCNDIHLFLSAAFFIKCMN